MRLPQVVNRFRGETDPGWADDDAGVAMPSWHGGFLAAVRPDISVPRLAVFWQPDTHHDEVVACVSQRQQDYWVLASSMQGMLPA